MNLFNNQEDPTLQSTSGEQALVTHVAHNINKYELKIQKVQEEWKLTQEQILSNKDKKLMKVNRAGQNRKEANR